nr:MAG TPA: hypothetical protein [Bacteriophage sp.]
MTQATRLYIWNTIPEHRIRKLKSTHIQNILLVAVRSLLIHRVW